jgi:EmrB/QacA subfamily drug resistance transporter
VLVAAILGSSMVFIDGTVVNVALPVLQSSFRASSSQVLWVVESYALFLASLILLGGSLGDRLGRRRIFATGVTLFTLASVLCGLAPSITFLTIARSIQGIGGALLAPSSLAIISASFDSDERGRAIGTWSGFTAITAAVGPVLGGLLVQHVSWRAVFFINVPFALVVLALVKWHVDESYGERDTGGIDWLGATLATIGLGALTYGLLTASSFSLGDPVVIASIGVGVLALAGFVVAESRVRSPMVPLWLFRSRIFTGANVLTLLLYSALGGALYFLPFNLIQIQHYSPTAAGLALLPFILIMFLLSRWSGGLVTRVGARLPLVVGPAVAAGGLALFARAGIGGGYWTTFGPAVVVLGLGMATSVAPLTTTVMSSVGEDHAGIASGINNAVSRTGGLIAVAVLGIVMVAAFSRALAARLDSAQLSPQSQQAVAAQENRLAAISLPSDLSPDTQAALNRAIADSFVAGFRVVMITASGLALAASLAAAVLIDDRELPSRTTAPDLPAGLPDSHT